MIVHRRVEFDFDPSAVPSNWYRGDLHLSTFFNSLSLVFPEGERFFVESVRRYRDRIENPDQRAAIDAFIGQEAMHGKGHRRFNDMTREQGLGKVATQMEKRVRFILQKAREILTPEEQLAVTCALEHFTAILAEQLLETDEHRDAAHKSVQPLWIWHALEESEHKAVAYDVYRAVDGDYARRVVMMLIASVLFFTEVLNIHCHLLEAQGELRNVRGWMRSVGFLWVRPGLFRRLIPAYFDYFRPGFHPDDRKTNAMVEKWQERLFGEKGELRSQLRAA